MFTLQICPRYSGHTSKPHPPPPLQPPLVLLTDLSTQRCVNTDERLKLIFQNARSVIYHSFIFSKYWNCGNLPPSPTLLIIHPVGHIFFIVCLRVSIIVSDVFVAFPSCFLLRLLPSCGFDESSSGSLLFAIRFRIPARLLVFHSVYLTTPCFQTRLLSEFPTPSFPYSL